MVAPAPPASGDGERPDVVAVRRVEQDGGFGLGLRGGKRRPVARDAYAVERVELVEHAPPEPIGDIRPFVQLGRNIEVAALAFDIHRFGIGAVASFSLPRLEASLPVQSAVVGAMLPSNSRQVMIFKCFIVAFL